MARGQGAMRRGWRWVAVGSLALAACSHGSSSADRTTTTSTPSSTSTTSRSAAASYDAAEAQRRTAVAAVDRLSDPTSPKQAFDMHRQWTSTEAAFTAFRVQVCKDVGLQFLHDDPDGHSAACRLDVTRDHVSFLQRVLADHAETPPSSTTTTTDDLVQTPEADCPGPTTADLVACNAHELAELDAERALVLELVATHGSANPAGNTIATTWGSTKSRFLAYRTIACTTAFDQDRDGTIAGVEQVTCGVALTRDHIAFLRGILVDQGLGTGPAAPKPAGGTSVTDTPAGSASCELHAFLQDDLARATTCALTEHRAEGLFATLRDLPRAELAQEATAPNDCVPHPAFTTPGGPDLADGTLLACPFGDKPDGEVGVWMLVDAAGPPYYVVDVGPR